MPRTQNEGLASPPDFTPHRVNVAAADPVPPYVGVVKTHGMSSDAYEDVAVQIGITGGPPSVDIECLLWSDAAGRFVQQNPVVKLTAVTGSVNWKVNTGGQRFFFHVSGTFSGASVSIYVAGMNPVMQEMA